MSDGPKRNPDRLNTIGVVVVGICGAVLVYVTIVALEAFYVNDTSEIQTMADYGGQDVTAKGHKADELRNITEAASNGVAPGTPQTYRIKIDRAMELVVDDAKKDPSHLVPALPPSQKATIQPIFGRPKPIATAAPATAPDAAGSGAGSAAAPAAGSGAAPAPAAGSGAGTGSGAPKATPKAPKAPKTPTPAPTPPTPAPAATPAPAGGHAP